MGLVGLGFLYRWAHSKITPLAKIFFLSAFCNVKSCTVGICIYEYIYIYMRVCAYQFCMYIFHFTSFPKAQIDVHMNWWTLTVHIMWHLSVSIFLSNIYPGTENKGFSFLSISSGKISSKIRLIYIQSFLHSSVTFVKMLVWGKGMMCSN